MFVSVVDPVYNRLCGLLGLYNSTHTYIAKEKARESNPVEGAYGDAPTHYQVCLW